MATSPLILAAPEGLALPELLADQLADLAPGGDGEPRGDGLVVAAGDPETAESTWYDTADGRLARWGVSVELQPGRGWTVRLPASDGSTWERRVRRATAAPPAEVTGLVTAFTRGHPLEPAGHARVTRQTLALHASGGNSAGDDLAAEVTLEEVHPEGTHPGGAPEPVRLCVVTPGPAAAPGLLEDLTAKLERAGATPGDARTRARLVRGDAPAAPEVTVPEVGPDASMSVLLRYHFATWTLELLRYDADVRLGSEDEPVHQARVTARRLRWILGVFGAFVSTPWAERLREDLRWLDEHLATVRDLDVTRLRLEGLAATLPDDGDRAAAMRLAQAYAGQRLTAARTLRAAMREPRYAGLLERLVAASGAPDLTPLAEEPAAKASVAVVAESWRRLRRAAKRTRADAADEQLHTLRRRARQARYTAEAAEPALGRPAARFARRAKDLQDELGEQHDAVVSQERLRAMALARGRRLGEAFAAGQLLVTERAAAAAHAAAWPDRWARLDRNRVRGWLGQA